MSFLTSEWLFPQKEHIVRLEARAMVGLQYLGIVDSLKGQASGFLSSITATTPSGSCLRLSRTLSTSP